METLYIIIVGILIALAISDLIVGVSNDAVNFLNSAIGSKVAPFWAIMGIASLGILAGALFSNGMMEVARKGIFHPDKFYFSEIIYLFLAVMLTDVILLDLFNTFGLPTSTTVSVVFELLGSAVAISVMKTIGTGEDLSEYINTAKALAIISGILLSVVVAFTVGATVQYIVRFFFTFNYEKTLKYFGAIWGGLAITAITYFILIKGLKGTSLKIDTTVLKENIPTILLLSFIAWTIILQTINWITKINVLKIVVLVGTFALAMAFAGNDLVNFIGVPLAGLQSYMEYLESGLKANEVLMSKLGGKVETPYIYLLIAGMIMVATLWLSQKARTVSETELNLSRQEEGYERFESNMFARTIVRFFISISKGIEDITPERLRKSFSKRFDSSGQKSKTKEQMFDLLRASVNLVVASVLISFATSLTLPLSTTYVTFMVAMGSSLADGAWGRESAVYRVSGVVTVILGWFFTAIIAVTVAFTFATILTIGDYIAVVALFIFVALMVLRNRRIHKKRELEKENNKEVAEEILEADKVFDKCKLEVTQILGEAINVMNKTTKSLFAEDRKKLKEAKAEALELDKKTKQYKTGISLIVKNLVEDDVETGPYYVQVVDFLREISNSITYLIMPVYKHVENNHKPLIEIQKEEITQIQKKLNKFFNMVYIAVDEYKFSGIDDIQNLQIDILSTLKEYRKNQIKRIKAEQVGTRNSMLYFNMLSEYKNLTLDAMRIFKSQRDFIVEHRC